MSKITFVGAGSVAFAKTLICDILQYPALANSTICLMDIDARRLATVEKLTRRIVAQLSVKAQVEATTDLRKACTGAKFVITAIQVGGYKPSTVIDFEIPAKYGVQQTIADTLGVGGVFRALRSIPVLANVARTVQEVGANDPVMLNYTNPMAMNMWAIDKLTGITSVGLCHSVQSTSRQLATYCGLDPNGISYRVAGINHMAFFLKFEYKGKDAYPLLFRALRNPSVVAADRVRFEMMRRLGYFVTESSEHQSEYVPYFIHHGKAVIEEFGVPINEYMRRCEAMAGRWDRIEQDLLDESKPVEIGRSVEYGSTIINSIVSGTPSVVYGNVPNRGLITNLTEGCSVEVPCLIDKQGIQPTHIGELPAQLAAIIHSNLGVQELTVNAAITGQREYIYQAVMMDPHTSSVLTLDKIWAMCDELIEAHQKDGYLGEFKPVVNNTGKPLSAVSRVFLSLQPIGVPFLAKDIRKAEFLLIAENETDKAFDQDVVLSGEGADVTFTPSNRIRVSVAAGQRLEIPLSVEIGAELKEALRLCISSTSLEAIEQDYYMPKRTRATIPTSGDKKLPIQIDWSGNRVADCLAWIDSGDFILEAKVDDTDVKTDLRAFWDSSALAVGIADPLLPTAPVRPVVVLPNFAEPVVLKWANRFMGGGLAPKSSVTVCQVAEGYTLTLRLNLEHFGIKPWNSFLCELLFFVNALGTTHGRISASWNGTVDPFFNDPSRFALLTPSAQ